MNEDTKEYTLDDLEDIIREYSTRLPKNPNAPDDPGVDGLGGDTIAMGNTVSLGDTVPVGKNVTKGDTRPLGDTVPFGKPRQEKSDTKPLPDMDGDVRLYHSTKKRPGKQNAEPYTANWEPEYDAPMGEYTPREPIEFPKNRQQILREKLENGAQQQYQKLNESGLSRIRAGLLLNFVLFVVSASTAILYHQVDGQRLRMMILGQVVILFLSALVGYKRLLSGVTEMLRHRFNLDSFLVVTLVVCWVDGLLCLKDQRLPFAAVFSLQMLMAQWAKYQKKQTQISQLDTLRKASELTAVVKNKDYYKHQCAYQTAPGQPEDFMDHYREVSGAEKVLCRYALGVTAAGGLLALVSSILSGPAEGVRVYAAALLGALPATAFICFQRPLAILEKRMHKLGTVLCGWKAVENIEKQGLYPLYHEDLFPENHVKLNGLRFYGERNPNTVVSYMSALMKADGGALAGPFEQLRASRNARVCKVEELTSYPGGVGGQIDGLSVIAGTLEFIENMGVELSEVSRIPHAVYAAVNQSLCAVVAVNFSRSKSSAAGLRTLCESAHVRPVLVDCDFALTGYFLEQKLGVDTRRMQFPDCMTRMTLAEKKPPENAPVIALATRNGLAQRAFAVTGGAALRSAWRGGAVVHMLGGSIGFLAVMLLAFSGATALLTPYNLLLYGFVWMIPGLLVADWTRNV